MGQEGQPRNRVQFPAVPVMMEVGSVPDLAPIMGAGFCNGVKRQRPKQRPKLPICFVVRNKKTGSEYEVWYFENLDLLVKNSCNGNDSEYQPCYNSFKPISKDLFRKILESSEFEVM